MSEWIAGLRESASLLMAEGHPGAWQYPLPVLWTETEIVRRRLNRDYANTAMFTQMAIASVLSEKGAKAFKEQVSAMTKG